MFIVYNIHKQNRELTKPGYSIMNVNCLEFS